MTYFFLTNIPYFNFRVNFQSSHLTKKEIEDASKRLSSYYMGALNPVIFEDSDNCDIEDILIEYVERNK